MVVTRRRSRTSHGTPVNRGSSVPSRKTTSCKCGKWSVPSLLCTSMHLDDPSLLGRKYLYWRWNGSQFGRYGINLFLLTLITIVSSVSLWNCSHYHFKKINRLFIFFSTASLPFHRWFSVRTKRVIRWFITQHIDAMSYMRNRKWLYSFPLFLPFLIERSIIPIVAFTDAHAYK